VCALVPGAQTIAKATIASGQSHRMRVRMLIMLLLGAAVLASSQAAAAAEGGSEEPAEAGLPASEYTGKHPWRRMRRYMLRRARASTAGA
jgi:hypothetical protein